MSAYQCIDLWGNGWQTHLYLVSASSTTDIEALLPGCSCVRCGFSHIAQEEADAAKDQILVTVNGVPIAYPYDQSNLPGGPA
jgi:hypothetical protein